MRHTITIDLPDDNRVAELSKENKTLKEAIGSFVASDRHHQELYQRWWQRGQTYQQQITRALKAMEARNYGHAEAVLRGIKLEAC